MKQFFSPLSTLRHWVPSCNQLVVETLRAIIDPKLAIFSSSRAHHPDSTVPHFTSTTRYYYLTPRSDHNYYIRILSDRMSDRSASPTLLPRNGSVDFAQSPAYSRLPQDDELFVMKAFSRHASHCASCARPYDTFSRGGTLCPRGHQRGLDVAQYLYNKRGHAFSIVDRLAGHRTHVEIPSNCEAVRGLLKAMENGLYLRRRKVSEPVVDRYDNNERHYSAPRRINSEPTDHYEKAPRYIRKPTLETPVLPPTRAPSRYRQLRKDNPYYAGRDTLFEQDLSEKESRYGHRQPNYYFSGAGAPVNPPPVPPKDSYWL